jgi:glycosyltransferase involved in cell wall biosynthesis
VRIDVVTTSYPAFEGDPGGHFVRAEVRELERAGHEVLVIAPRPGGAFGWPGAAERLRARPWRALDAARWTHHAASALAKSNADRVIAHWAVPSAWPIAVRGHAPVEVVSHGADVRLLAALPRAARGALVRAIARRASAWRFASDALLGELVSSLDPSSEALLARVARVVAPRLEVPDVRAQARALRAANAGRLLYVVVGRLVRSKRVCDAIDHARRGRARLVVVGDGPERARLEQQARGADVRFTGTVPRDEALAWIGAADALLFASRAEGLSTVVREAEALGVRVERVGSSSTRP